MRKRNDVVVVGIFAGAGGLDLGLKQAGFEVKVAIELDKTACETYKLNNPETTVWCADIADVRGSHIKKVVGEKKIILAGGPPCQSWSDFQNEIKDSRKGLEDQRGQLIYQYLRIAHELKDQLEAVVFENVAYMVGEKHLNSFNQFRTKLNQVTGLKLQYQVLNAIDYGTAQLRERVIMLGVRGQDTPFQHLEPLDGPRTLREALRNVPESDYFHFKREHRPVMEKIKEGQCWNALDPQEAFAAMGYKYKGVCNSCRNQFQGKNKCPKCGSTNIRNGFGITSYFRRLSWSKPSFTICTVSTTKEHGMLAHPTEQRGLSIRECARIQGFPDDFQFKGKIWEQQRAIGNAVPVPMGKAIGLALQKMIPVTNSTIETTMSNQVLNLIRRNPKVNQLTTLEKDFLSSAIAKEKRGEIFPERYNIYLNEIHKRIS
ncbi:DNA cytosine methyltransferase (plasmid) [Rossellomorea sp. AcN35-11]|nr:DNA cytosine methyltransferase [Rossellomorea aquimaris]WJV31819.1 DNA cytosine methyltransferase [Rossellomorea sp. AcN35-11]